MQQLSLDAYAIKQQGLYPSTLRVLNMLRSKGRKGITFSDFPAGFELRKRLKELRDAGYQLTWEWEEQFNGGRHKRTFLLKES
jgi:hypothetical protein